MFNLSLPVQKFDACLAFYRECFGAKVEMLNAEAANVFAFGGQVTFHNRPDAELSDMARRTMHFGQVVSIDEWLHLRDRIISAGYSPLHSVTASDAANGRAKRVVADPSGNLVEINSAGLNGKNAMELLAAPLEGRYIRLEPVEPHMREEMRATLDCDPETWAIQFANGRGDGFAGYWAGMLMPSPPGSRISFGVRLLSTGQLVGTTSFHNISSENRTVEIGSTFYRPEVRGTTVNPEAKLLLLDHAFGRGALRVQLTVDSRNERSQAAVTKLGAAREGILRRHCVTWTGHLRDTVMFSIIDTEWPDLRERVRARLESVAGAGSARHG
jgi:RimJ/RimL family protein N-acetyltransferase/extradiol dioxygenase family protein